MQSNNHSTCLKFQLFVFTVQLAVHISESTLSYGYQKMTEIANTFNQGAKRTRNSLSLYPNEGVSGDAQSSFLRVWVWVLKNHLVIILFLDCAGRDLHIYATGVNVMGLVG